ncbi:MAG: hypothetical protein PWP31_1056 [Clostridia bacterium]|nr:hypothetical protein [Clostridia bacterium]
MNMIERNEYFWQRLFDSLFRRGSNVALQPVEIAKKLAKTMLNERTVSVNRVYVPNVYLVNLSPQDFERIFVFKNSLAEELSEYLKKKASEQNYSMVGEPRIEFEIEEELPPGKMRIYARLEEDHDNIHKNSLDTDEDTLIYKSVNRKTVSSKNPLFELIVVEGPDINRTFMVGTGKYILGRQPTCDFILKDEQVSRRHCQFEEIHGRIMVTDLGSRNGTLVNNSKIDRTFLKPGDFLKVGVTVLEFKKS